MTGILFKDPAAVLAAHEDTFRRLAHLLIEGNARLNVTALRTEEQVWRLHFEDSLQALRAGDFWKAGGIYADLGTGGGYPALPLAIALPECQFLAVDSVAKKVTFVAECAAQLGLRNVEIAASRSEELARTPRRGTFTGVLARAVGPVAALLETGLPLLTEGGRLMLYKTAATLAEWEAATPVLAHLGGNPLAHLTYRLPGAEQDSVLLMAEKTAPTPDRYPRRPGIPFKKPLNSGNLPAR